MFSTTIPFYSLSSFLFQIKWPFVVESLVGIYILLYRVLEETLRYNVFFMYCAQLACGEHDDEIKTATGKYCAVSDKHVALDLDRFNRL